VSVFEVPSRWPDAVRERVLRDEDQIARLALVEDLIFKYSKSLNLTGSGGRDAIREQIGEGVAVVLAVERALGGPVDESIRWIDVGSGGGFPGLAVAACSPAELFLVEPRAKRVAFLEMAMGLLRSVPHRAIRARLSARGIESVGGGVTPELRYDTGFDVWGARAVFSPEDWTSLFLACASPDAVVVQHLGLGAVLDSRLLELARVDFQRWSVVVGKRLAVSAA
jgi:16S rRNA G527 N7-methylase RsmG